MKPKKFSMSLIACCTAMLFITETISAQNTEKAFKMQKQCILNCHSNLEMTEIIKTIEYYVEGGRKGDSKITKKAFTNNATMSWSESGQIRTVPIKVLYDIVDKSGASTASYKLLDCNIEQNIAIVKIQSQFGPQEYIDMFTLIKDIDNWKIVSKIYRVKI